MCAHSAARDRSAACGGRGWPGDRASRAQALAELEAARAQARAEVEAVKAATAAQEAEAKAAWEAVKEARRAERRALYPRPRAAEIRIPRPAPPFKGPPGYEIVRRLLTGLPIIPERLLGMGEFVNVLTAGDDKVCQECEDLAAGGPYSLEEAQGRLPAHVNCRCA